jgi:2-dehydropantoate 2-reductase
MKIIVYGAGAIGSVYAAMLSRQHDVTIIARPRHAEAIQQDGLHVTGREEFVAHLNATTSLGPIPPETLVLLTTKVRDNAAAGVALADKVRSDTLVLCIQNGLRSEEIVRKIIGDRCPVLRAVTQLSVIFTNPGFVHLTVPGHTLIERHERSEFLAALLTASGLDGRVCEDIQLEEWRKLIFNCLINPITSILGSNVGAIADPNLDPLKQLVIDECLAVARRDGVSFDFDFQQALRDTYGSSLNVVSMRQDLLHGKPTEIDYMNGAVVALGQRFGIECPVNAALVAIIKAMERQHQ